MMMIRITRTEAVDDGVSKAAVHRAVDDEVDGTVDEHQDVPDVAERRVHGVEQVPNDGSRDPDHAQSFVRSTEAVHSHKHT